MIILHLKVDNRLDTFLLSYEISNDIITYHSLQVEISNKKGASTMDTPFKIVYFTQPEVYPFSSEISFFTVHFLAILLVQDPGFVQVEFIDQFACWS